MTPVLRTAPLEDTVPDLLGGRYRVVRELGSGGMGTVYLVEHVHTGEPLALKLLKGPIARLPVVRERFRREMQAPARIRSEYVVRVSDADLATEADGAPFLVMELLQGCDLAQLLQGGPLSSSETLWILRQVARALDRAHAAGVIHRDLKPPNLFLHRREDGSLIVKVLDFGIAKLSDLTPQEATTPDLTRWGNIVGTPSYMAPEQALGHNNLVGPACDRWALGIVAFRLLTGLNYWQGDQVAAILLQITSGALPRPSLRAPALGPAFDAWFQRACAQEPAQRWPDAERQIHALAVALGVTPSEETPPSLQQRLGSPAITPSGAQPTLTAPLGPPVANLVYLPTVDRRAPLLVTAAALAAVLGVSLAAWILTLPAPSSNSQRPVDSAPDGSPVGELRVRSGRPDLGEAMPETLDLAPLRPGRPDLAKSKVRADGGKHAPPGPGGNPKPPQPPQLRPPDLSDRDFYVP